MRHGGETERHFSPTTCDFTTHPNGSSRAEAEWLNLLFTEQSCAATSPEGAPPPSRPCVRACVSNAAQARPNSDALAKALVVPGRFVAGSKEPGRESRRFQDPSPSRWRLATREPLSGFRSGCTPMSVCMDPCRAVPCCAVPRHAVPGACFANKRPAPGAAQHLALV